VANAIGAIEILTATLASKFSVHTQYSFHRTPPMLTVRSGLNAVLDVCLE